MMLYAYELSYLDRVRDFDCIRDFQISTCMFIFVCQQYLHPARE
jgi:hypothetical protein